MDNAMRFCFVQHRATRAAYFCITAAVLGIVAWSAALAAASSASPWVSSNSSKVRLVSATGDGDGAPALIAGVQLRMNSGWKTYWKNPGDSGVPPSFDWTGSNNLKQAEVLYPAPIVFPEADGVAIGYEDEVVFPVKLTPERPGEPIELKLAFSYGLCKDLCVPNDVNVGLVVAPDVGKGDAALLAEFLARVPKPGRPGVLPEVASVVAKLDAAPPELVVDAVFPPGTESPNLFIYAGEIGRAHV